jgi:14-3-3 protein epsilon
VLLARLAEESERPHGEWIRCRVTCIHYRDTRQDVIKQIKGLIQQHSSELTIDERNLLSVAYKNVTNLLRNSWRSLDALEKAEIAKSPTVNRHVSLIRGQKGRIEHELMDICKDIIGLLDTQLLSAAQGGEETVFYLKM